MSVIKRIDVKDYLAARRRRRNGLLLPTSLPVATGFSRRRPPAPANPKNENLVADSFKQPGAIGLEILQTVAVPSLRSALLSPVSRRVQR
jgi:hypothetical protein